MRRSQIFRRHSTYAAILFLAGLVFAVRGSIASKHDTELTIGIAGVIIGFGLPMYQRFAERDDAREAKRLFAVAFGTMLLPKLKVLADRVRLELDSNERKFTEPVDVDHFLFFQTDDRWTLQRWLSEQWQALAQCDVNVVENIVRALTRLETASTRIGPDDAVSIEEIGGEKYYELTIYGEQNARAHIEDLRAASDCLRAAIKHLSVT